MRITSNTATRGHPMDTQDLNHTNARASGTAGHPATTRCRSGDGGGCGGCGDCGDC